MTQPDPRLAPLTPTATAALLEQFGLAPRRADGQNFLVDPNVVDRILRAAELPPGALVLEVGPGLGALTRGLLRAGHPVTAIEIDAGFVRVLEQTLGHLEGLHLVHDDAMSVDVDALVAEVANDADVAAVPVVANLPYNVATPLLFHLLAATRVSDLLLMVQAEVGERWTAMADTPAYGAVSLKLQMLAAADVAFRVPPGVFLPVPRVDSVMVRVRRRHDAPTGSTRTRLLSLVDECFTQPRKTLRNNLLMHRPTASVEAAFAKVQLEPSTRPGRLVADTVIALDRALEAAPGG